MTWGLVERVNVGFKTQHPFIPDFTFMEVQSVPAVRAFLTSQPPCEQLYFMAETWFKIQMILF
jgi:hypothetical protein